MDINDYENNDNKNPIIILEQKLDDITKKLRIISVILNDISQIEIHNKKINNSLIKLLKNTEHDFDIFSIIHSLQDCYLFLLISDMNNFLNNILCNFTKDTKIILASDYMKNVSAIINRNKDNNMLKSFIDMIECSINNTDCFDYYWLNIPDVICILAYVIQEYKLYEQRLIENTLIILNNTMNFFRKNDRENYKRLLIFLEESKIVQRLNELCTIELSNLINNLSKVILAENWELLDIYVQEGKNVKK